MNTKIEFIDMLQTYFMNENNLWREDEDVAEEKFEKWLGEISEDEAWKIVNGGDKTYEEAIRDLEKQQ